jgi:hypothetical protein
VAKETWLKIFCYKFSSIPLLGKNSLRSNSFPHCHSITLNLFNAKYLRPIKYKPNKNKEHLPLTLHSANFLYAFYLRPIKYEPNKDAF